MAATGNRAYPLPEPPNFVSEDVFKLIQAFQMIDADVAATLTSLAGKSPMLHGHSMDDVVGLVAALAGKSPTTHNHSLGSLSDVSAGGSIPNGYVLARSGGMWVPAAALDVIGAHEHSIGQVTNLQAALDSKLTAATMAAATLKPEPEDADTFPAFNSASSNALIRFSWSAIKARLKAYFDTLYSPLGGGIPTGTILPYGGDTAPSGYYLCFGQELSRTDDAALFAVIGTRFGAGNGTTTFNAPDHRERGSIGKADMGGTATNRMGATLTGSRANTSTAVVTGLSSTAGLSVGMTAVGVGIASGATILSIDSATQVTLSANHTASGSGSIRFSVMDTMTLGASGGAGTHTLTEAQMPSHTHTGSAASAGAHTHTVTTASGVGGSGLSTTGQQGGSATTSSAGAHTHTLTINAAGSDRAHPNVQPSIVTNFIIKR